MSFLPLFLNLDFDIATFGFVRLVRQIEMTQGKQSSDLSPPTGDVSPKPSLILAFKFLNLLSPPLDCGEREDPACVALVPAF